MMNILIIRKKKLFVEIFRFNKKKISHQINWPGENKITQAMKVERFVILDYLNYNILYRFDCRITQMNISSFSNIDTKTSRSFSIKIMALNFLKLANDLWLWFFINSLVNFTSVEENRVLFINYTCIRLTLVTDYKIIIEYNFVYWIMIFYYLGRQSYSV